MQDSPPHFDQLILVNMDCLSYLRTICMLIFGTDWLICFPQDHTGEDSSENFQFIMSTLEKGTKIVPPFDWSLAANINGLSWW